MELTCTVRSAVSWWCCVIIEGYVTSDQFAVVAVERDVPRLRRLDVSGPRLRESTRRRLRRRLAGGRMAGWQGGEAVPPTAAAAAAAAARGGLAPVRCRLHRALVDANFALSARRVTRCT